MAEVNPAQRAVLDQERAFIRDELDRAELQLMLEDKRFCVGVNFAFTAMLHRAEATPPLLTGLALLDLSDAWQEIMRDRHGV